MLRQLSTNKKQAIWLDLKKFNRQPVDLERFWMECLCCVGDINYHDGAGVDRALLGLETHSQWDLDRLSPMKVILNANVYNTKSVEESIRASNMRCHPQLYMDKLRRGLVYSFEMMRAGQPDIKTATIQELMAIRWINPTSAALFSFYSNAQSDAFPIDGNTILWLNHLGHHTTATDEPDMYMFQMMLARQELENRGIDPHDGYERIWRHYACNSYGIAVADEPTIPEWS